MVTKVFLLTWVKVREKCGNKGGLLRNFLVLIDGTPAIATTVPANGILTHKNTQNPRRLCIACKLAGGY